MAGPDERPSEFRKSRYPEFIDLARELIPQYGMRIKVQSPENTVAGQEGDPVFIQYETDALVKNQYSTRLDNNYTRTDFVRWLLPAGGPREPRVGDVFTTPEGRKYIAETISLINPDGVAIVYDVTVRDG